MLPPMQSTVPAGPEAPSPNYNSELRHLARRSGQKFKNVVQDMLSQINEHLNTLQVELSSGVKNEGLLTGSSVDEAAPSPGQQGEAAGQPPSQPAPSHVVPENPRPFVPLQSFTRTFRCKPTRDTESCCGACPQIRRAHISFNTYPATPPILWEGAQTRK